MESTKNVLAESEEKLRKLGEEQTEKLYVLGKNDSVKILNNNGMIHQVPMVKCEKCGKLYYIDSKDYISFLGDVCVGMEEVVIRKNEIRCNSKMCLEDILRILPKLRCE